MPGQRAQTDPAQGDRNDYADDAGPAGFPDERRVPRRRPAGVGLTQKRFSPPACGLGHGRGGWTRAASWLRLDTPSLVNDRYKWDPTVRGETNSRAAISGLVRPSAASRTIWRSE